MRLWAACWVIFTLSLDVVMGYAGLVPLGHTMFYGVGAYAAALTISHFTSSVFVVLLGAGAFIGAKAILFGYTEQWRMIIGAIFVFFVLFVPRGRVSVPSRLANRIQESQEEEPPLGIEDSEGNTDD